MNRTRVLTTAAVGALLAVAATSIASPWWTLHRLRAAVERHDGGAVAEQVDFPALRTSVKAQMLASMKADLDKPGGANPFAEFGTKLAQALVDPLVDAVVSPAAVAAMVEHGRISIARPGQAAPAPDAEPVHDKPRFALRYRSWDRFAITGEDGGSFVFRRDGLWTWKLAAIEMAADR
ncbi:DUF2939 domain-containing protein [Massilia rhizosphaerae]|uniref:DUF2939 domain-containing protein n=1 Tax=Massilia rhizosphaerae TaxID=2784389 RepID=UPI0018DBF28D|nr:DUF2939 domain-containing protein [Massilia rhizosphaerae]